MTSSTEVPCRNRVDLVAAAARPDQQLGGHRPLAGVQQEGLLRRKSPLGVEAFGEVLAGEVPIGGVPGRALPVGEVRAGWDVPALHDLLEEAVLDQQFPFGPFEVFGADRLTALGLEAVEGFQGAR